jgi:hypothetical protein
MRPVKSTVVCSRWLVLACIVAAGLAAGAWRPGLAQSTPTATPTAAVSGNLYASGGDVQPGAAVDGDFVAAGGRVVVDRPVTGDLTLAGGSIMVRAPVGDDVRAAGGDVRLESTVGGEVFVAAGSVTLTKEARVAKAATLYGGSVAVDGKIDGPLKIAAQKMVLNGEVLGDVRLYGQQIELGPMAKLSGSLQYPAMVELKRAAGASVGGPITRARAEEGPGGHMHDREWPRGMPGYSPMWAGGVFTLLALLACAALLVVIFPVFLAQAAAIIKTSPGQAVAVGLASLVAVPLLAGLLFITVLGIPLGIVAMMLYPALLLVGFLLGVYFIAQRAQAAFRKDAAVSTAQSVGLYALTLVAVMLLVNLPLVGPLALVVITILGTGACVLELNRRRRGGSSASAPMVRSDVTTHSGGA